MSKLKLLLVFIFSFYASVALALKGDRNKPLHFVANKMLWDQKLQKMRYSGNVEITQGEFLLKSDLVYITRDKGKKANISSFIATGVKKQAIFRDLPKVEEDEIKAWADEIIYDTKLRKLTLTGNAKILRGKDEIQAPVLFYYLDSRNIEARGTSKEINSAHQKADKDRIQIIISPETLKSAEKKDEQKPSNSQDNSKQE